MQGILLRQALRLVEAASRHHIGAAGLVGEWAGLFEHAAFEEETVTLHPGDFIVAFSDGVTEAFDIAGDEYSDARLLASIERHRGKAAQELIDGLLADVKAFTGEAMPNDDLTLVMVQYTGSGTMAAGSARGI